MTLDDLLASPVKLPKGGTIANAIADLEVNRVEWLAYPWLDRAPHEALPTGSPVPPDPAPMGTFTAAVTFEVRTPAVPRKSARIHNVVVSVHRDADGEPDWRVTCGAPNIEAPPGRLAHSLVLGACGSAHGTPAQVLLDGFDKMAARPFHDSCTCGFAVWHSTRGEVCKHVAVVLDGALDAVVCTDLLERYDAAVPTGFSPAPAPAVALPAPASLMGAAAARPAAGAGSVTVFGVAPGAGVGPTFAAGLGAGRPIGAAPAPAPAAPTAAATPASTRDALPLDQVVTRVPVLIEGDRGAGKTREAWDYARRNPDLTPIFIQGHEDVTARDLLGYAFSRPGEPDVWMDGELTQAFRAAAAGQTVLLIVDEILRIPSRQLNAMVSALAPVDGHYLLKTGRLVNVTHGIGAVELLRAPVERVRVIATTNMGARFAVDALDPAFAERWVILRRATDDALLRAVLPALVAARGFAAVWTERLIGFFKTLDAQWMAGHLDERPTLRTLARAIDCASDEAEISRWLDAQKLLWVARNDRAEPIAAQVAVVDRALAPLRVGRP